MASATTSATATATGAEDAPGALLLAGFAEAEITPSTEGVRADGTPFRRSFTVYDPLMARVLVLRQGQRVAALVGLDVFELGIGFDRRVVELLEGSGLTADGLLCCPSHVGMTAVSNYGAYLAIFAQDLVIESYEAECARRVAGAVREALAAPRRCASRPARAAPRTSSSTGASSSRTAPSRWSTRGAPRPGWSASSRGWTTPWG